MSVAARALEAFAAQALEAAGADEQEAGVVAEVLVWCDRAGRRNQGVQRLPILCERLALGLFRSPCRPRLERAGPALARLDGGSGLGHYLGVVGMRAAIEIAREAGVGLVAVRHSNFFGAGAYYVELAARANMLGLAASNSYPKVAAHGGAQPVFGTNPFAFAAPQADGRSVLLDMATSASAGSTIRQCLEEGRALPEGIAVDVRGEPITDPAQVEQGTLLPFGGAKGYGLALMVEILAGLVAGAGVSREVNSLYADFERSGNSGHLFVAVDLARLLPLEAYFGRMQNLGETLRASGAAPGAVRLPGEARWESLARSDADGIALDPRLRTSLEELARKLDLRVPW